MEEEWRFENRGPSSEVNAAESESLLRAIARAATIYQLRNSCEKTEGSGAVVSRTTNSG